MDFRGVLFDFDGVLASSSTLQLASYNAVLQDHGQHLTRDDFVKHWIHATDQAIFHGLSQERGLGWTQAQVDAMQVQKIEAFLRMVEGTDLLFPGIRALTARLSPCIPLGVVSMSTRVLLTKVLEQGGARAHFDLIVAVDDVTHPKPHPEPYAKGVEKLNRLPRVKMAAVPSDVAAVEDSAAGVHSAKAAGLVAIGILTTQPEEKLREAGADVIVPDVAALDAFLS
ncbi:MAG: HAD family phosphatase [Planctomycetes bacterium]|nr:HAD family phosphatase [Planctomycetota bacterium]